MPVSELPQSTTVVSVGVAMRVAGIVPLNELSQTAN